MVNIKGGLLIFLILMIGCAPKPVWVSIPDPALEMDQHPEFQRAGQALAAGHYVEALDRYNAFLREAFDAPFVDAALFDIGVIFRKIGRYDDAVAVFLRLRREFPHSARIADAMLEVLQIRYARGYLKAVIAEGQAYTETLEPGPAQGPFFLIVADAYGGLGAHLDAARFYYRAWNTASAADADKAWSQFETTTGRLGADDIQELMLQMTDRSVLALLLYRLGMVFIVDEAYDDALDVLQAFVDGFADHPEYSDALDILNSLKERARFIPYTIGCVLPLSGEYAVLGQRALNGIELALNRLGRTSEGVPFTIIVRDTRSNFEAAVKAVSELDQHKVGAILGPMVESEAAAAEAQARGIPIMVFTQREGIPDIGPYVFRNFITPHMQVRTLVTYAMQELGARRFAVFYPDESYGQRFMHLFWDQVIDQGGVVTSVAPYDPDGVDFADSVKKLAGIYYAVPSDLSLVNGPRRTPVARAFGSDSHRPGRRWAADPVERLSGIPLDRRTIDQLTRRTSQRDDQWQPVLNFDALFIPDAPKKAGLVIPQLAFYDIRHVHLLGTNLWNSETLLEMSGQYMQDTLIVDGFFSASRSGRVNDFVAAFKQVFGTDPGIIEAMAYDSAMVAFEAMRRTASDSRRDLKQRLLQADGFEGLSGRTAFAPNGEVQKRLHLIRIDRGRFVEVQQRPESLPSREAGRPGFN